MQKEEVISDFQKVENPIVKAKKISFYLSDLLKQKEVNLYEAYLLNGEIINYTREWGMFCRRGGGVSKFQPASVY